MDEVLEVIAFYKKRSWDWRSAVAFTLYKQGYGYDHPMARFKPRRGPGRPRKSKAD